MVMFYSSLFTFAPSFVEFGGTVHILSYLFLCIYKKQIQSFSYLYAWGHVSEASTMKCVCFECCLPLKWWFFEKVVFSSVQLLSRVWLFVTPWIAACQVSLSITNSRSLLKLMSIESVMTSSHLILCRPLLACPQSFPALGSFPLSQLFTWGGQSIGVSASTSILPMNTQDWSPLGWTGWISLQSKGLSSIFSNTTVQKHQFFGTQIS